jgi:hypothetical protein
MPRIERSFDARSLEERSWITQNTWCDACEEADLGLRSPREYEDDGRVFVEGECRRCGQIIQSTIIERESGADER